jgi:hypothetical protein
MAVNMVRENSSIPAQLRTYGDVATRRMHLDTVANGGTTVDLATFKVPAKTDGFFVGAAKGWNGKPIESVKIPASEFSLKTLRRAFGKLYAEHLTREEIESSKPLKGAYIGTWADEDGTVHVDAVNWTADREEAIRWGLERGELAIYDVAANGSLDLDHVKHSDLIAA